MSLALDISIGILVLFGAFIAEFFAVYALNYYVLNETRAVFTVVLTAFISKIGIGLLFLLSPFVPMEHYLLYPPIMGWVYGVSKAVYKVKGDRNVKEKEVRWPDLVITIGDGIALYILFLIL